MANNDSVVTILDGARGTLERLEAEQRRAKMGKGNGGEPPMDTLEQRVTRIEDRMATKEDVGRVELDMAKMETRLIKWSIGSMATMTAILAGLMTLFKFLH